MTIGSKLRSAQVERLLHLMDALPCQMSFREKGGYIGATGTVRIQCIGLPPQEPSSLIILLSVAKAFTDLRA